MSSGFDLDRDWEASFDDDMIVDLGKALNHVRAGKDQDAEEFRGEIGKELDKAESALEAAIDLRKGELALQQASNRQERLEVMDAATTVANPEKADGDEVVKSIEKIETYL